MSNRKMFRYEWIWQKRLPVGFLNSRKMPQRIHENILVFYKKLPTYNPQMREGKPYKCFHRTEVNTKIYGQQKDCYTENPGVRYPIDVIEYHTPYSGGREKPLHPTQKPVNLLEYLIKTYTNEGEIVLDNCIGSGSTAVACMETNRNFIGFETDKNYFEIANKRIDKALEDKEMRLFA